MAYQRSRNIIRELCDVMAEAVQGRRPHTQPSRQPTAGWKKRPVTKETQQPPEKSAVLLYLRVVFL